MTPGERRFAHRLEEKLEDDYLCWYDIPVGPKQRHPDFVVFHPRRGLLVLEVKDWKLDSLRSIDKSSVTLVTERGLVNLPSPLAQARGYALEIVVAMQRDPALLNPPGHRFAGKLIMPWGHGVVLSNISRAAFDRTNLGEVLPPHLVICQDEFTEAVESDHFQERLWGMFASPFACWLTLPQIDRVRWHLFPDIRIAPTQDGLFQENSAPATARIDIPDLIRVMDLQQEQLARSLGDGHRVIHGVAGSGKTMILGYRCQYLARSLDKPVLVLCYNKTLAARLRQLAVSAGIGDRVSVRNFHAWCHDMLRAFHVPKPNTKGDKFFADLVESVINGVDKGQIPRGQYGAVLIDEGHDFQAEWLRLVVQMVDPATNSLLLLYDDAQSIYAGSRREFSFASVGIQARGRTTILRLNYRNTLEILTTARAFAAGLLASHEVDEDQPPNLAPESSGRRGRLPELIHCGSRQEEVSTLVARIEEALASGRAPSEIAVLYRHWDFGALVSDALRKHGIPHRWAQGDQKAELFDGESSVKIVTLHSSKGLEFPLVFIPGVCSFGGNTTDGSDEARLLYVGITRALEQLVLTHTQNNAFSDRIGQAVTAATAAIASG